MPGPGRPGPGTALRAGGGRLGSRRWSWSSCMGWRGLLQSPSAGTTALPCAYSHHRAAGAGDAPGSLRCRATHQLLEQVVPQGSSATLTCRSSLPATMEWMKVGEQIDSSPPLPHPGGGGADLPTADGVRSGVERSGSCRVRPWNVRLHRYYSLWGRWTGQQYTRGKFTHC